MMHVTAASPVPVRHWIEFLDETFAVVDVEMKLQDTARTQVRQAMQNAQAG